MKLQQSSVMVILIQKIVCCLLPRISEQDQIIFLLFIRALDKCEYRQELLKVWQKQKLEIN